MTFTKEILTNYCTTEFGNFESCNLFKLYDNENVVGQFIVSEKVAFLSTTDSNYRIDISNHFFRTSKFEIIDIKSETKIGFYDFPIWRFGWKEIGDLVLNNVLYTCKRQRPEIRNNIFKKSTWGHSKVSLKSDLTEIIYHLQVETRWLEPANSQFRKAKGEINCNRINIDLVLLGLFFIERMLDIDDSNSV